MNPAGIALVLVGAFVLVQLVKGDALGRLGIAGAAPSSSGATGSQPSAGVGSSTVSGTTAQQAIVRAALSQQGAPYKSVSDPPHSYNCSTFTAWVYKTATNMDLAPLTWTQMTYGSSVPVGAAFAQPGDLIFSKDSEGRDFGHVGIVIDPHTKIHAPHTGDVVRLAPIDWGSVEAVRRLVAA